MFFALFSHSDGNIDLASLAASYAFGIANNNPFADGNKRTSVVVLEVFLELNNYQLTASNTEIMLQIILLASNEITQKEFADFIRKHIKPM